VFALGLLVAAGVRGAAGNSTVADVTGVFGPVVSGTFPAPDRGAEPRRAGVGAVDLPAHALRHLDEAELEDQLQNRAY